MPHQREHHKKNERRQETIRLLTGLKHVQLDAVFRNLVKAGREGVILTDISLDEKHFNLLSWLDREIIMELGKSEIHKNNQRVTLKGVCSLTSRDGLGAAKFNLMKVLLQRGLPVERVESPLCTTEFLDCEWEIIEICYCQSQETSGRIEKIECSNA